MQKYYKNESRFNGFFSRNTLPKKIKDGAYVMNLDEYADAGTQWIALFCNRNEIVYFDSFDAEHIPEEIKEFIGNKNVFWVQANVFWVQAIDSVLCCYFCIGFIDFMLAGKKLTDYTSLFSPHNVLKKRWYNFVLFQKWISAILLNQLTKQAWLNKPNFD